MISNRLSGDDKSLRHYTSTPHLDTYRSSGNGHYSTTTNGMMKKPTIGSTFGSTTTNNLGPYQSTFSTFSHNKSGADVRYRDDPNPYKVSTIDEFRIKVQDPYKSNRQIHQMQKNNYNTYYAADERRDLPPPPGDLPDPTVALRRLSIKYDAPQYYQHSTNSGSSGDGEYEIPDPDYDDQFDGSTAGSSDDLPIPDPLTLPSPPNGDSCEEYSISISASEETASASHSSPSPTTTVTKISDEERAKIEHALRGRKTSIYVADSLANLYYMSKSSSPPRPNSTGSEGSGQSAGSSVGDWVLKYTGVPCLLLDTGETKNRDRRQIQIILAESCTGLALWKDVVDNLTSYRVTNESSSFHTMHLSSDHTTVVGLSFDDEDSAEKFAHRIDKLTSDFANISLSGSKGKHKKDKTKVKPVKYVKPKKTEISQPCGFMHVSSIKHGTNDLSTLQPFVKSGVNKSQKSPLASDSSPEFSF